MMSIEVKYAAGIICLHRFSEVFPWANTYWASARFDLPDRDYGRLWGIGHALQFGELFTVTDLTSDAGVRTISLQNVYNGRFVCPRGGDMMLCANHESPDGDDIDFNGYFTIDGTDEQFTMKSVGTGRYVSCDEGKGYVLYADRNDAHDWEQFRLVRIQ